MIDILYRIMNILERVRYMEVMSVAQTGVFAVLLAFGVINCVLGYRLLRFWMMLFGFVTGAALGFWGAYVFGNGDKTVYIGAMLAAGIILAVIAFLIYKAGIFLLGAGLGCTVSIYFLHPTTSAVFFLCILLGIGLGSLGMKWAKEVIIVGTSIMGGVLAGFSLAKLGALAEIPYGIGMSIGFSLLGMLIQFAINRTPEESPEEDEKDRKRRHSEGQSEEYREYEEYRKRRYPGEHREYEEYDRDEAGEDEVYGDYDDYDDYEDFNENRKSGRKGKK